jgi:broad-specificity NMP kinase
MNYEDKYIKYKQKYLNLTRNNIQSGSKFNKKYILIDGTSSLGKISLCKYFKKLDYKCVICDNYVNEMTEIKNEWLKILSNNYITKKEKSELCDYEQARIMIRDAIKSGKAILDAIHQKNLLKYLMK